MRAILVGTPTARARLRATLTGTAVEIAGEVSVLPSVRDQLDVDAWIVAPDDQPQPAQTTAKVDALTPREIDVLNLVARGMPNKAIAERLAISDQTVKFHVASITSKLGAHNRTEAVRLAVGRGLITF
jgi:DNA-binding NarL/FixJ family response regulator